MVTSLTDEQAIGSHDTTSNTFKYTCHRVQWLFFQAHQVDKPEFRQAIAFVNAHVIDANDNAPTIHNSNYTVTLPENAPNGSLVLTLTAEDRDIVSETTFEFVS